MTPAILLLVDKDESLILDMMGEALSDAGFEVGAASDGSQAPDQLNAGASRLRAVITDIRLGAGLTVGKWVAGPANSCTTCPSST